MGIFDTKEYKKEKIENNQIFNTEESNEDIEISTRFGRKITTANNAKKELYFKPDRQNPALYINQSKNKQDDFFYGMVHKKNVVEPFYLPADEVTMQILIGSTRTGKGILLGNMLAEKIARKEGVIIIDPKQDAFLPQIAKEILRQQDREEDLLIANYPFDFGYSGINKDDTYQEIANKLIDAFGLEETGNPGVDHYRKNERVMLKKVLKLFFNGGLGEVVPKDLNKIAEGIVTLSQDLKKKQSYEEEMAKNKPNFQLIEKTKDRYFDADLVEKLNFVKEDISTLESLAISFDEFVSSATIENKINLDEALYNGKVIYLKIDMLDISSLKMAKICITDAIQKARKKLPSTKIWIFADEISFYANQTLAAGLATAAGFNLIFVLALQDISQMKDIHIRNAILSNANVKIFYKPSDELTLNYLALLGGKEAVTTVLKKENDMSYSQTTEEIYNSTRVRSLPRAGVGILVSEYLSTPVIIQTNFIAVKHPFKWEELENQELQNNYEREKLSKEDISNKVAKYRQKFKGLVDFNGVLSMEFENEKL